MTGSAQGYDHADTEAEIAPPFQEARGGSDGSRFVITRRSRRVEARLRRPRPSAQSISAVLLVTAMGLLAAASVLRLEAISHRGSPGRGTGAK